MEQRIIKPLEEGYQEITIRTTNLEKYFACPFKYKFEPQKSESRAPFKFGRIAHTVCQGFLLNKRTPEISDEDIAHNIDMKEKILHLYEQQYPEGFMVKEATDKVEEKRVTIERLRTFLNLVHDYYKDTQFILAEHAITLEIHYGKYKLIISGSLDLVTSGYSVVDLKTGNAERKEESIKKKLQKLIYLYGMYKATNNEDLRFEYVILRTDYKIEKNVKLQTIKTHIDIGAIEYVLEGIIKNYLYSEEHNIYPTKQGDDCRYCQLGPKGKSKFKCPLFDNKEITGSEHRTEDPF